MIRELVVVEGIHDVSAVRRAVEADVLCTGGHAFGPDVEERLRRGAAARGLIVLTDPDPAGDQIRRRVEALVGVCAHAHVPRAACTRDGDVGIEYASQPAIRRALSHARTRVEPPTEEFSAADLFSWGLSSGPGARARRAAVGARLGIGMGNTRQFVRRLNAFGISRAELEAVLAELR